MRPTGVRSLLLLATVALLPPAVACSATPEPPGAAMPSADSAAPGSRHPAPSASTGDPDNPRDLAGAPVVLTGTVHVGGGCVVVTAHGRRWALLGEPAGRLADGQTVTVRGRPVAVPAGCDADHALAVRSGTSSPGAR